MEGGGRGEEWRSDGKVGILLCRCIIHGTAVHISRAFWTWCIHTHKLVLFSYMCVCVSVDHTLSANCCGWLPGARGSKKEEWARELAQAYRRDVKEWRVETERESGVVCVRVVEEEEVLTRPPGAHTLSHLTFAMRREATAVFGSLHTSDFISRSPFDCPYCYCALKWGVITPTLMIEKRSFVSGQPYFSSECGPLVTFFGMHVGCRSLFSDVMSLSMSGSKGIWLSAITTTSRCSSSNPSWKCAFIYDANLNHGVDTCIIVAPCSSWPLLSRLPNASEPDDIPASPLRLPLIS